MRIYDLKVFIAFGVVAGFAILWYFYPEQELEPQFTVEESLIPPIETTVAGKDDAAGRFEYMINLQVDPKTGKIPFGIYQRERAFVEDLPVRTNGNGSNLRTRQDQWNALGPVNAGGRTRAFAIDVRDNSVLVAGSVSGSMWISENGGQTWTVTSSTTNLVGATAVVQDTRPGHEDTWYYGTGEIRGNSQRAPGAPYRGDGIFKSVDGARSWFPLPSTQVPVRNLFNSSFNYVNTLLVNHQKMDIDEVYAAVYGAILRSRDGGATWSAVLGDDLTNLEPDVDLNTANSPFFTEIKQSESGIFYAYLSESTSSGYNPIKRGVFRSVDGDNWTTITPPNLPDSANRGVLAIAPTNEHVLYMFVHHGERETDDKAQHSLWKYAHAEPVGTWEDLSANIPRLGGDVGDMDTQNSYNMVLEVHPNDEDIVFVGGTNLYRSLDGFSTSDNMEWIGGYDTVNNASQYPQHHADQHNLFFLKTTPFRLYSAHDGGISFTDVSTITYPTWVSINSGYITSQFYAIDLQMDESSDFMLGGAQDIGSWFGSSNSLSPWLMSLGGDGAFSAISQQAQFLYASAQRGRVFRIIPDFIEQRLVSFTRVDPAGAGETIGQEYLFINPFILDPNNTGRMFIAGGDAMWRNNNLTQIPAGGRDPVNIGWEKLEATVLADTGQISALVASIEPANRVYYGTTFGQLFRIDDAHFGQGIVSEITADDFPDGNIINIVVNPENADELLVAFSNYDVQSIFHSTNGGNDFTAVGGNLEEFEDGTGNGPSIRWMAVVPMQDNSTRFYAGTSTGLYSTGVLDGVNTVWEREGAETIGMAIVSMIKYRTLDGRMVVSTHGNGVYSTTVAGSKRIDPPTSAPGPLDISIAYPNPFDQQVTISYTLPDEDIVLARIFDLYGNWIATPLWGTQLAGAHEIVWDGRTNLGQPAPDGVYVVNIQFQGKLTSQRLILER